MRPENVAHYWSPHVRMPLTPKAYENQTGVSFTLSPTPTVRAEFNSPVSISTVALQRTYENRTSNIRKFNVSFITMDDKPYLDPVTGKLVTWTTTDDDDSLTVQHDLIDNLKGLNLTVMETTGGFPTWFRLKVLGCYKPRKFSFLM